MSTSMAISSLKGKCAVITGGSRGIGLEAARGLAQAGADIAILYRSATKDAESAALSIGSQSGTVVEAFQCNVNDPDECNETFRRVVSRFGRVDVVVVNAGVAEAFAAEEGSPEQSRRLIDTNLNGAFFTAQAAAKIFKERPQGNIIFTASVSAILVNTPQKQAIYNASKAGVIQLARSLAVEWADFCRVNCISPGYVATDMTDVLPDEWKSEWLKRIPMKRMCRPEELRGVFVFCASDMSSYMTGSNLIIDGGLTLA